MRVRSHACATRCLQLNYEGEEPLGPSSARRSVARGEWARGTMLLQQRREDEQIRLHQRCCVRREWGRADKHHHAVCGEEMLEAGGRHPDGSFRRHPFLRRQSADQSAGQLVNQATNQPIITPIINQATNRSTNQSTNKSTNRSTSQSTSLPPRSANQPMSQSSNQPISQSASLPDGSEPCVSVSHTHQAKRNRNCGMRA